MYSTTHNSNFTQSERAKYAKRTAAYTQTIAHVCTSKTYDAPESSLKIAGDARYQNAIARSLARFAGVKHVVLVGIGGSSLGTQAVYEALKTPGSPTLTVLDALEVSALDGLDRLLKKVKQASDVVLVIISKSGGTTETILNASHVLGMFEKKFGSAYTERVIAIGDEGTEFQKSCKKKKILTFSIPSIIGGRYSVFTAVGIVPLTLLGIDVALLRKGASDAVSSEYLPVHAEQASLLALHAEAGVHTLNFFTFNASLQTMGYWYRQLLAESIGKSSTKKKKAFTHHILPTVSTSIDLHSLAQLYLGGYPGVYTHFVCAEYGQARGVLENQWLLATLPSLAHAPYEEVKRSITTGVLAAYDESQLPYMYTHIPELDAYAVGFFLASRMAEVMYLCDIFDVDAFNQPHVELYKKHMRSALGNHA